MNASQNAILLTFGKMLNQSETFWRVVFGLVSSSAFPPDARRYGRY